MNLLLMKVVTGSPINVVSKSVSSRFKFKPEPRPLPNRVARVDKTSLQVYEHCLEPIPTSGSCSTKTVCDVLPIYVA